MKFKYKISYYSIIDKGVPNQQNIKLLELIFKNIDCIGTMKIDTQLLNENLAIFTNKC